MRTPEQKAARRLYNEQNKGKIHEQRTRWREENREIIREKKRLYNAAHAEEIKGYSRRHHAENRDEALAACRLWREKNAEKKHTDGIRWHKENAERSKQNRIRWQSANTERLKQAKAEYRSDPANREREKATSKRWRDNNRERILENARKNRAANKLQRALLQRRRDALKAQSGGRVTPQEVMSLWKRQNGKCVFFSTCGNLLKEGARREWHVDHIEPLRPRDATRQSGRNSIDNIQILCATCNTRKNNSDPYQFAQQNGLLFCDIVEITSKKATHPRKKAS